jgi:hypothetical protein
MSIHVDHDRMSSDTTKHHAWRLPVGRDVWEASWLPGRLLDRSTATTAMVLAETVATAVGTGGPDCSDPVWLLIDAHAAELGLTGPAAVARLGA